MIKVPSLVTFEAPNIPFLTPQVSKITSTYWKPMHPTPQEVTFQSIEAPTLESLPFSLKDKVILSLRKHFRENPDQVADFIKDNSKMFDSEWSSQILSAAREI